MQGIFTVINIALSLAAKSLAEITPYDFDGCLLGFRFIIEFSVEGDKVILETAQILNSDWELMEESSRKFAEQVSRMVENRNVEYRQFIEQSKQIREDRTF